MKFAIVFQILVILIAFLVWDLLHISYQYQQENYYTELEQLTLIVFSKDLSILDSLQLDLEKISSVKKIKINQNKIISENIIESYELDYASDILQNFTLPSVMEINFHGDQYDRSQKARMENLLLRKYPDLIINFDNDLWFMIRKKIDFLNKIYLYGNLIYISLFLFITIFLRIHFEIRSDQYWQIFKMSGGKLELRRKKYLIDSLSYLFIPFSLSVIVYALAITLKYLPYKIYPRMFAAQFISILLSILISGIILGSRKK